MAISSSVSRLSAAKPDAMTSISPSCDHYGARLPLTFGPVFVTAGFALFAVPNIRAFLILAESVGDSRIGISLIQHVSWNGGQLAWRELILLICVSELWRQFCGACRAGQWRCVSMSASRAW